MIIPTTSQLFIYKLTLSLKLLLTKTTLLGLLFLLTITFSYISCCLSYQNLWTLWLSIYIYTISIRLNIKLYGADEGLTLETSAKHHIPQATNIPYQPC